MRGIARSKEAVLELWCVQVAQARLFFVDMDTVMEANAEVCLIPYIAVICCMMAFVLPARSTLKQALSDLHRWSAM